MNQNEHHEKWIHEFKRQIRDPEICPKDDALMERQGTSKLSIFNVCVCEAKMNFPIIMKFSQGNPFNKFINILSFLLMMQYHKNDLAVKMVLCGVPFQNGVFLGQKVEFIIFLVI